MALEILLFLSFSATLTRRYVKKNVGPFWEARRAWVWLETCFEIGKVCVDCPMLMSSVVGRTV